MIYEVIGGETISYLAAEMVRLANETHQVVMAVFNGSEIYAEEGDYPLLVRLRYQNERLIKANLERLTRKELLKEELCIWRKNFFS